MRHPAYPQSAQASLPRFPASFLRYLRCKSRRTGEMAMVNKRRYGGRRTEEVWKAERGKGRGRELFLIRWRERERKKLLTLPPPPSYTYLPSLPRWMGMGCNLLMEENSGAVAEAPYYMNAGIARPRHDRITQPSSGIGVDCYMATPTWMDGGRMMADTAALPSSLPPSLPPLGVLPE